MVIKVSQLFRLFFCVCVVFFVSCDNKQRSKDLPDSLKEQLKIEDGNGVEIKKETRVYNVEGVDNAGNTYRGIISLVGDVGDGRICSDTKEHIYIDVKRSLEGGVEGVDNNGNVYQLLFTNKEE